MQASGRNISYFFEGDQGPSGEVGPDGSLYYIVGHVDEVLDPDTGFTVTSFKWSGSATDSQPDRLSNESRGGPSACGQERPGFPVDSAPAAGYPPGGRLVEEAGL